MFKEFRYQGAIVCVRAEFGMAYASVTGEVTKGIARQLIADSPDWCVGRTALSQSVDYTGARVLIDADHFLASLSSGLGDRSPVPTAVVASRDQLQMFESYARMARSLDIPKDVFTSAEGAYRWTTQQGSARADRMEARYRHEVQRMRANSAAQPGQSLPVYLGVERRTVQRD